MHQFERFLYAQGRGVIFPVDISMPVHAYEDEESELRRRFGARVDSALRRFVIGLQLDEAIDPGLEKARRTARWLPRLVLPAIIATAVCGWLDGPTSAGIAAGASVLLLAVVYLLTQVRLSSARNTIFDKLEQSSATLRELLAKQVTEDVTATFGRFLDILNPAQASAAQFEEERATHLERLGKLSDSFAVLEKQIQALNPGGSR